MTTKTKTNRKPRRMTVVELPEQIRCGAKARAAITGRTLREYLTALVEADMQRSGMSDLLRANR